MKFEVSLPAEEVSTIAKQINCIYSFFLKVSLIQLQASFALFFVVFATNLFQINLTKRHCGVLLMYIFCFEMLVDENELHFHVSVVIFK